MKTHLWGIALDVVSPSQALAELGGILARGRTVSSKWVYFFSAHSFNCAIQNANYRETLDSAHFVYPEGVALRCAARLKNIVIPQYLSGTDIVPVLLKDNEAKKYSCYLLGDTPGNVTKAARWLEDSFPGWKVSGFSDGYLEAADQDEVVAGIRELAPDLLLVAMGTPRQELFIHAHAQDLGVPLCIGVGGLFRYWSGSLTRAPSFVQSLRLEWLWILLQQPHKVRRYTLGAFQFFARSLNFRDTGDISPQNPQSPRSRILRTCRNAAKRTGRKGAVALSRLARGRSNAGLPPKLRVLTYHRFHRDSDVEDGSSVAAENFLEQVRYLAASNKAIDHQRFDDWNRADQSTHDEVLITIDDGHKSGLEIAAPILEEFGISAVFFIPAGLIGAPERLTVDDIRELHSRGFHIGSHGLSHRPLTTLDYPERYRELAGSRSILEEITGNTVNMLAYPYGTRRDFDSVTESMVQSCGYCYAFSSQHGPIADQSNQFCLPRIKIEGRDSVQMFRHIVAGGMDLWRLVDRHMWWLQGSARNEYVVPEQAIPAVSEPHALQR